MSIILALDIGKRRTGIAFGDTRIGMMAALETITHTSTTELVGKLQAIVSSRRATSICIGLPLLPDGTEGEQARYVRDTGQMIEKVTKTPIRYIDERYTSQNPRKGQDADAEAACAILQIALDTPGNDY